FGFFGGKRFVPIITGVTCLILAIVFGYVWPPMQTGLSTFGTWLTSIGAIGTGIYGICNVLLLPFGLHHVLNSLVWFIFGDFTNAAGEIVSGDLYRFFAGDPTAGSFMAGAYPIFMFGMLGAALAMYKTAKKENRAKVGGVLFSAALIFALTGIGEPLLFSFCFVAPLLYAVHAVLMGSSYAICSLLGIKHGFGFSAGLIDYGLNYGLSTKGWMIIPLGLIYFVLYYFIFSFLIKKFNFQTPGREEFDSDEDMQEELINVSEDEKISKYIEYLGGADNFKTVEACITRLRLSVTDDRLVNEKGLKSLGAAGVIRVKNNVQVVVGTQAESIAETINSQLKRIKQR
ncbi:MAG: PTS transporter subunit EIIC, partial [Oscillospiraceae bacterium]